MAGSSLFNLHLISDFNIETLGRCLEADTTYPSVSVSRAPFGQVFPALFAPPTNGEQCDSCFVWTSPDVVLPSFKKALAFEPFDLETLHEEVMHFVASVKKCHTRFTLTMVASWDLPPFHRGLGLQDLKSKSGIRRLLLQVNLWLASLLEGAKGIYLLDAHNWSAAVGKSAWSPKLWYLSKTPYISDVFNEAVRDIKAAIRTFHSIPRKLVVLDLDDTLWGGVVGDVGWQNILLGGHDHRGEAFVDFQRSLKSLSNRGIVLAIVSKNQSEIALQVLRNHPEMVLREQDFAGFRINWNDKAANIAELSEELRLGLQSIVFIDDNPAERARVREALPEVLVPDWPADVSLYSKSLLQLDCFDGLDLTDEDLGRSRTYVLERERQQTKVQFESLDQWLHSLNTEVLVEEWCDANRARIAQLLNKTNQFNLRTRRLSDSELADWLQVPGRKLWAFRVRDRFGDSGITGILSLQFAPESTQIVDFVLSCRVMGRDIERSMLSVAVRYSQQMGQKDLVAGYRPTPKNSPCLEFFRNSGFTRDGEDLIFRWNLMNDYDSPAHIALRESRVHVSAQIVQGLSSHGSMSS